MRGTIRLPEDAPSWGGKVVMKAAWESFISSRKEDDQPPSPALMSPTNTPATAKGNPEPLALPGAPPDRALHGACVDASAVDRDATSNVRAMDARRFAGRRPRIVHLDVSGTTAMLNVVARPIAMDDVRAMPARLAVA